MCELTTLMYKIKDNQTGLYSMGGSTPLFTKTGKIWKKKTDLDLHIKLVEDHQRRYPERQSPYEDCIVEVYEVTKAYVYPLILKRNV